MTRAPSEAVIEAVERAQTLHGRTLPNIVPHTCVCGAKFGYAESYFDHYRVEVARATEAAALRAAADDYFNMSSGTKARPHARSWLRARANKLTDTDERSK